MKEKVLTARTAVNSDGSSTRIWYSATATTRYSGSIGDDAEADRALQQEMNGETMQSQTLSPLARKAWRCLSEGRSRK